MNCKEVEQEGVIERHVTGRLSQAERREFESHLSTCEACAARLALSEAIRRGFALEAEHQHEPAIAGRSRSWYRSPVAVGLLAAAALAGFIALWSIKDGSDQHAIVALGAVTESDLPPYIDARLRTMVPGDPAAHFQEGMEAYSRGDHKLAARRLASAVDSDPARLLWRFYLGASLVAAGDPESAAPHLRAAVESPPFFAEASWLLAKARLQQGDAVSARRALEELAASGSERAEDATRLLQRLNGTTTSR